MMTTPLVSVVMTVHNGAAFLREAIDSVLGQSWEDFEFLIVNDGSTDESRAIVLSYGDPRMRLIDRPHGFVESLNSGLREARGRYIARHDADDVSMPERLAAQVDHLRSHPDVGVVGTAYIEIDEAGTFRRVKHLESESHQLKWLLLFANQFRGTAVMFQRELARAIGGFQCYYCDDYDLWSRMAPHTKVANLRQPLVKFRVRSNSHSMTHNERFEQSSLDISAASVARVLGRALEADLLRQLRMAHSSDDGLIIPHLLTPQRLRIPMLWATTLDLIERFCVAHDMSPAERTAFKQWATTYVSHRLLILANRLTEWPSADCGRLGDPRRSVPRLIAGAARAHPGILIERATWALAAKAVLGAELSRTLKRAWNRRAEA